MVYLIIVETNPKTSTPNLSPFVPLGVHPIIRMTRVITTFLGTYIYSNKMLTSKYIRQIVEKCITYP